MDNGEMFHCLIRAKMLVWAPLQNNAARFKGIEDDEQLTASFLESTTISGSLYSSAILHNLLKPSVVSSAAARGHGSKEVNGARV